MKVLFCVFALALLISVVSAKSEWDVTCYLDSCSSCEYSSVCDDACGSLYSSYSSSCYSYWEEGPFTMDCYCELNGGGWFVVLFCPLLFVCWCCLACVAGGVIVRKAANDSMEKRNFIAPSENSFIVFSAQPGCGTRLGAVLLSCLSCGLLLPFIVVKMLENYFDRFWFAGEQGEFRGNPFEYCFNIFCVNNALTCFTCGFWTLCGCARAREAKWIDENTTVKGTTGRGPEVFLFQARPALHKRLITAFFTCITCGIAGPLFVVRNLKETVVQMRFGKKAASFEGDTDDYVDSVCAPTLGLNVLTCGLYNLCGFAEKASWMWMDKNMKPAEPQEMVYTASFVPPQANPEPQAYVPYNAIDLSKDGKQIPAQPLAEHPPPYQYSPYE